MDDEEILATIVDNLRHAFRVRRILLFGSRATGCARQDSDYDVIAEVESDVPFWERQRLARRPFARRTFALDLLALTPDEIGKERHTADSIVRVAEAEGRLLYGH